MAQASISDTAIFRARSTPEKTIFMLTDRLNQIEEMTLLPQIPTDLPFFSALYKAFIEHYTKDECKHGITQSKMRN